MENGRGEGGGSEFYNPDQWWPQGNSDSLGMSRELPISPARAELLRVIGERLNDKENAAREPDPKRDKKSKNGKESKPKSAKEIILEDLGKYFQQILDDNDLVLEVTVNPRNKGSDTHQITVRRKKSFEPEIILTININNRDKGIQNLKNNLMRF